MTPQRTQKPSVTQVFLLCVVIPAFLLATLELGARALEPFWSSKSQEEANPKALEMPTWMLREANSTTRPKVTKDDLEWLKLFTEGDGYRVHLVPNTKAEVINTFSLIPADRERRRRIVSNSLGFRGPEIRPKKPAHTFRILIFGDSSSFGWGVNDDESWAALLQRNLQERYPQTTIEVANFAIPGDSSAYGRLIFDTYAPRFESDLVILGFGANDAKPVQTSHSEQVSRFKQKESLLKLTALLRASALYRGLEQALAPRKRPDGNAQTPPVAKIPAVAPADYAENMSYMATRSRALGNQNAILLTLCTPGNYSHEAKKAARKLGVISFNGQAKLLRLIPHIKDGSVYPEYAQAMEASYPSFLRRDERFYITSDGCHPNELGHRFVADQLAALIENAGLVEASVTASGFAPGQDHSS